MCPGLELTSNKGPSDNSLDFQQEQNIPRIEVGQAKFLPRRREKAEEESIQTHGLTGLGMMRTGTSRDTGKRSTYPRNCQQCTARANRSTASPAIWYDHSGRNLRAPL
jgi:hypothetical protein